MHAEANLNQWCENLGRTLFLYNCTLNTYTIVFCYDIFAAVNGHLELSLLKDGQRFDAISTSIEVYKFRDWWILTYFVFGHGESWPNNIWSMVNLERTCILLFYYFLWKWILTRKNKSAWGIFTQLIFTVVNLDPIIFEKRWIDGESWPNDYVEKVNRGEDLRWVGSRCPLMRALKLSKMSYLPHRRTRIC